MKDRFKQEIEFIIVIAIAFVMMLGAAQVGLWLLYDVF